MIAFEPGATIGSLVIDRVSDNAMKTVAALMDDPNPIHWDPHTLAAQGLGRPLNQGPVTISYLISLAARAAGSYQAVKSFDARFHANVFAGDRLECSGTVVSIDGRLVTLELMATVDGRLVASAKAIVSTTG